MYHNNQWYRFVASTATFTGHNTRYILVDHHSPKLPTSHVAVAWIRGNELFTHGIGPYHQQAPAQSSKWYFEWIDSIPQAKQEQIAEAIKQHTAIALTDGSYKQRGAAGYCIGASLSNLWRGACRVPGHDSVQSSYRSELTGVYATMQLCNKVCELYKITDGSIILACDNLGAGHKACQTLFYPGTQWDHFDLLQAIYRLRQKLPIKVYYQHVEGHQRTKHPTCVLDDWAVLNERMDGLAKAYLSYSQSEDILPDTIDEEEWHVKVQGKKICIKAKQIIERMLRQSDVIKYWTQPRQRNGTWHETKFTQEQLSLLDVNNIQKAWDHRAGQLKRFICKMAVDQLATGKYMKRMRFWPIDKCPRCLQDNETTLHVLQCTHPEAKTLAEKLTEELVAQLGQYPSCPQLTKGIQALLKFNINHTPIPEELARGSSVSVQMRLPCHEFVRGRIVTQWGLDQQDYFNNIASPKKASRWVQFVTTGIWNLFFQMWLHRNEHLHSNEQSKTKSIKPKNSIMKYEDNGILAHKDYKMPTKNISKI